MAFSDSTFMIEIFIDSFVSYDGCTDVNIIAQFADIFLLTLEIPSNLLVITPKTNKRKHKKKVKPKLTKSISASGNPEVPFAEALTQSSQSVLFASNPESLIANMKKYTMELAFWSKENSDFKIGSSQIPWNEAYIDFLNRILNGCIATPSVAVLGEYNIFNEFASKRMASIKMKVRLTHVKDVIMSAPSTHHLEKNSDKKKHVNDSKLDPLEVTGIFKTVYPDNKHQARKSSMFKNKKYEMLGYQSNVDKTIEKPIEKPVDDAKEQYTENLKTYSMHTLSDIDSKSSGLLSTTKSLETMQSKKPCNPFLHYIYLHNENPTEAHMYYVGYCTVENDFNKLDSPTKSPSSKASNNENSEAIECIDRYSCCSLGIPKEVADIVDVKTCQDITCNAKTHRYLPQPPDTSIHLDVTNITRSCCHITEEIEEVVGGMTAKMKMGPLPCECTCECTFGFQKRTKYCVVCGGYEALGDDFNYKQPRGMRSEFPCPIFHKLVDKGKLRTQSTSGSDSKKSVRKSGKGSESEKDGKSKKAKKKDDRFKFNYGYKAPQIGHSKCVLPCCGTLGAVPKRMGWLWTAECVPGLKFRPGWKPGAANKHVVRMLKIARNPNEVIKKKRKKEVGKKRKNEKRPMLIIHKKDGEYTVTMEPMKPYIKQRAVNQYPYDNEKELYEFTVGRTEEENRERQKKKERHQRRLEREQRAFIQSTFKDMCEEICLKTYQQALQILPDAEDPTCKCFPAEPNIGKLGLLDDSCSCSEDKNSLSSDTDLDEWIVEFTPPNALYDPKVKSKKMGNSENGSQYNYLDYRVKLLDMYGNEVPRFFKGPDGKQQCSDLGGFWGPNHKWQEINIDGFIAPDNRWCPMLFIGPGGDQVDGEPGKFQLATGEWLVIGVDGYVDNQGKWRYYSKPRTARPIRRTIDGKKGAGDKDSKTLPKTETTWSCFGDADPRTLSQMGIVGHGQDKKMLLSALKQMVARGEKVRMPMVPTVPKSPMSKKQRKFRLENPEKYDNQTIFNELAKCRHAPPSEKGIVAVNASGNKTYFRLKDYKSRRPQDRIHTLKGQGIALSSFHLPCFHSFINTEMIKQKLRERLMTKMKNAGTQI